MPDEDENDDDVDETALWQRTVDELTAKGATPAEAIDGANIVLQAFHREREEQNLRRSGRRRRRDPPAGSQTG